MEDRFRSSTSHDTTGDASDVAHTAADNAVSIVSTADAKESSDPSPVPIPPSLNGNPGDRAIVPHSQTKDNPGGDLKPNDPPLSQEDGTSMEDSTRVGITQDNENRTERRVRNLTASLDDLFARDRAAPTSRPPQQTSTLSIPEQPPKKETSHRWVSPGEPSHLTGADNIDQEDDDDDLYAETAVVKPSSAPHSVGTTGQNRDVTQDGEQSDDDSDILQLHTDDELDQGVMINVSENHELQPPAWYNTSEVANKKVAASNKPHGDGGNHSSSPDEGEICSESSHDEMIRYADASASNAPPASLSTEYQPPETYAFPTDVNLSSAHSTNTHQPPGPLSHLLVNNPESHFTLEDLDGRCLERQVRYFYVGCDPATIPITNIPRCEICMGEGHWELWCHLRRERCTHCKGDHIRANCHLLVPCPRCHEIGHPESQCQSTLRVHPDEQHLAPCKLCGLSGHLARDCEVLWRSNGPYPWAADLPVGQFRAVCYECGRPGHLGNDCATRRPGKPMGTTSWSGRPLTNPPPQTRPIGFRSRQQVGGGASRNLIGNGKKKQFRYRSPLPRSRDRSRSPTRGQGEMNGSRGRSQSYSPPGAEGFAFGDHGERSSRIAGAGRDDSSGRGEPFQRGAPVTSRRGGSSNRGRIHIPNLSDRNLGPPPPPFPIHPGSSVPKQQQGRLQSGKGMGNKAGNHPSAGGGGPSNGQGQPKEGKESKRVKKTRDRGARGGRGGGGSRGGRDGGRGGGGGGGEKYRPMPGSAARAWSKGFA